MGTDKNRYALFQEGDVKTTAVTTDTIDPAKNPFLNQVADDSIPWQEVKKRGAPAVQPVSVGKMKTLVVKDQSKSGLIESSTSANSRDRIGSASTAVNNDKLFDPHENWCGMCSQKFMNKSALLNHIKHTPDHKHYCNLCKRVFKDRNGLKNHVDHAIGHDVFCNLCLSAFNDEWGLKNHFENNYAVDHQFICLTCLLGFHTYAKLQQHLDTAKIHTWCESCHHRFRNQDERDGHWQTTTKHKHCMQPGCSFDGPTQAVLDEHLERDHFQCVGCRLILPSNTKLNQHMEKCTFAIACPQCFQLCAGQTQLALHSQHCFFCNECGFCTQHEGNYKIHLTKHAIANISCWGCDSPMRTYSSMINHLESGKCPSATDPAHLLLCLGKWWYSPLFMDIDIHAQLRTGRAQPDAVQQWTDAGVIQPFICREDECGRTFGHFSSLVLHCESQACGWDVARLNMPGLEQELQHFCIRRDSASA